MKISHAFEHKVEGVNSTETIEGCDYSKVIPNFDLKRKALDGAEGHNLFGSISAAIFLLSASGTVQLMQSLRDPATLPPWWGTVDVALAFVVAVAAFGIQGLAQGNVDKQVEQTAHRSYRSLRHALLALGVVIMLAGDRIKWVNCATGFLWRTWLLLYTLPWWLVITRRAKLAQPDAACSKVEN